MTAAPPRNTPGPTGDPAVAHAAAAADHMTVTRRVLRQASRTPAARAVVAEDGELSYSQLVRRARALAAHLRRAGVGSGDVIGVALPRTTDLVVALLGVQLSGAAYLPLDLEQPTARLDHMLTDARATTLVTAAGPPPGLTAPRDVRLTDVPADDVLEDPAPPQQDCAYVLYTSGSSGRPKGVLVGHDALANLIDSVQEEFALPADLVMPATTTVSFDIAQLELWLPLVGGGVVVLGRRAEATDPQQLAALLDRCGARALQATPTSWRLLLSSGWQPPPGFTVLCGGERLPSGLAADLLAAGVVLWDLYGPTETTIWSTLTRYESGSAARFRPIRNTALRILDARLSPVADGATGELYIGGRGLAHGYLGRPDLTAQRFIADPSGDGSVVYRTGDLARRVPDGRIEVLGRTDDQVKVRGFRIEPAEVESALSTHEQVAGVVVRAEDAGDGARLVAYVHPVDSADPAQLPSEHDLRRHLDGTLPEYMIPAAFVLVASFPTTPNGKLDRASVADATRLPATSAAPVGEPGEPGGGSAAQRVIACALACALARERIDSHDDFFVLGGDSLRAVQAILRINTELGTDLPISALFEMRTVYGLTQLVDHDHDAEPALVARGPDQPVRLSSAQLQLWLQQQLDPGSARHNRAVAIRVPDQVLDADVRNTLTELQARHEVLRTCYRLDRTGVPMPVELLDGGLLQLTEDPATVLARELAVPFDLGASAPLRAFSTRWAGARHLLLVVHDIAADNRSRALMVRQVRAAFRGRAITEPALRYVDFAGWQRERADSRAAHRHLDYWRSTLAGLQPASLRRDRPRPTPPDGRAGAVSFVLAAPLVEQVRGVAADHDAPLAIGLLAGMFGMLDHHSDDGDLSVGVLVDGRDRPELEHLVGAIESTIVFRLPARGLQRFADVLAVVREIGIGGLGHAIPALEDVVAAADLAAGSPDPGPHPMFSVSFALRSATGLNDLVVPAPSDIGVDLHCELVEQPDGAVQGRFEFSQALFDHHTVARLANDFTRVLGSARAVLNR